LFKYCLAIVILICATSAEAQVTLTKGTNFSVDVTHDGKMVIDLLGKIWIIPANGGAAKAVTGGEQAARRPRWSPDGTSIVYQLSDNNQQQLWLYRVDEGTSSNISDGEFYDHQPSWHPDGQRIVYSSDRRDSGFDLWEIDLPTGLTWQISNTPGDETEPVWSADGQDLAYIHRHAGQWSLMLRRLGQPDRVLQTSVTRMSNPSWRPDGSLITVMRHAPEGLAVDMVILSDPLLIRPLLSDEDFFIAPVAWRDRHQLLYTANGGIRTRLFNSWTSSNIPFRAAVKKQAPPSTTVVQRPLPIVNAAEGQLVIRSARLFDGMGGGYREGMDVVIDAGRISAVESRRDRPGAIVVDMGDLTVLPGFIDADASLPTEIDETLGPLLLSFGVTTLVADTDQAEILSLIWSGKEMPGPRVLGSDWQLKLDSAASLALGAESLPTSPRGIRYEDARVGDSSEPTAFLSRLADARTDGLAELLQSRQAKLLRSQPTALRRFVEAPLLAAQSSSIVLASKANGLPPGIALHAEFLALAEAGLDQEHVLRTAGINAAKALGLGLQAGRIAVGSSADLILVDGDPLTDVADALKIVGVIRNGRFFSTIGLIERSEQR
jgi:Tol biopolymer transport system component